MVSYLYIAVAFSPCVLAQQFRYLPVEVSAGQEFSIDSSTEAESVIDVIIPSKLTIRVPGTAPTRTSYKSALSERIKVLNADASDIREAEITFQSIQILFAEGKSSEKVPQSANKKPAIVGKLFKLNCATAPPSVTDINDHSVTETDAKLVAKGCQDFQKLKTLRQVFPRSPLREGESFELSPGKFPFLGDIEDGTVLNGTLTVKHIDSADNASGAIFDARVTIQPANKVAGAPHNWVGTLQTDAVGRSIKVDLTRVNDSKVQLGTSSLESKGSVHVKTSLLIDVVSP